MPFPIIPVYGRPWPLKQVTGGPQTRQKWPQSLNPPALPHQVSKPAFLLAPSGWGIGLESFCSKWFYNCGPWPMMKIRVWKLLIGVLLCKTTWRSRRRVVIQSCAVFHTWFYPPASLGYDAWHVDQSMKNVANSSFISTHQRADRVTDTFVCMCACACTHMCACVCMFY